MRHGLFAVAVLLLASAAAAAPKDKEKDEDEKGENDEADEKEEKGKKEKKKGKAADDEADEKEEKGKKDKKKGKAGDDDDEEDEDKEGGAGMMDSTAPDPAGTEGADKPEKPKPKRKPVVKTSVAAEAAAGDEEEFFPPRKKLRLFGEVLIGFGGAPLPGPQDEELAGSLFTIRIGGSYDFSKRFSLGLLIPWTTGTVEEPASAGAGVETTKRNTQVIGNPMITAEIRSPLGTHTTVPWGLAVGIPVAQGNPDLRGTDIPGRTQYLLNAMADANSGWRDGELFASKRLPVVPFVGIAYAKNRLEGTAFLKFAFMFNTGGEIVQANIPNTGTLELNSMALRSVLGIGGKYWFLKSPKLFGGLDFWTVHNTIQPIVLNSIGGGDDPNPLQWVLEPRVGARFGAALLGVGYVFPLGGQLSDASASGLRIGVDANF